MEFLFGIFISFLIIYFAVRLAISPILKRLPEATDYEEYKDDTGLVKLRDIEVLDNVELEEVIKIYEKKGNKNKNYNQYIKFNKVLSELKEIGYFTEETFIERQRILKKYYGVD